MLEEIQSIGVKEKETELAHLKSQKKVLVKEVKTLRQDFATLSAERDEAQKQLDALQTMIQSLMQM
jgi:hypothetical protein